MFYLARDKDLNCDVMILKGDSLQDILRQIDDLSSPFHQSFEKIKKCIKRYALFLIILPYLELILAGLKRFQFISLFLSTKK